MDTVFVVTQGTSNTFLAVAEDLNKAQRYVLGNFSNAEQVDDFTWNLPNGVVILINEAEVL